MKIKHTILPAVALSVTFGLGLAYHVATSHAAVTNTVQEIKDTPMTNNDVASPIITPMPEATLPVPDETATPSTSQSSAVAPAANADATATAEPAQATPAPAPTINPIYGTNPNAPMGDQGNGIITSN